MGISRSLPISTVSPVLPGANVQQSVYTDAGFTSGDYVYRYNGNSVGSLPYFTTGFPGPIITTVIAGTKYNFNYGTGTLSRSNLTTPIALPSTYTLTTPVATSMGSAYLAQQAVTSYAPTYGPRCALLTNGNIVVIYQSASGTLSYKIYNTSGTALYSGDIATGLAITGWTNSREGAYDVCGLNAGGFAVAYTSSTSTYINTYTSTATLILSSGAIAPTGYIIGKICADPGDSLYTIGTSTVTAASGTTNVTKYSSSLAVSVNSASLGANYYVAPKIVFTLSGHLGVSNDTSSAYNCGIYYTAFASTSFTAIASSSFIKSIYAKIGICASLENNGGAFFAAANSSAVNIQYAAALPSATIVNNSSFITDGYASSYSSVDLFSAYINTSGVNDGTSNGAIVYYTGAAGNTYYVRIANLASDRNTWSSGASSYATNFVPYSASGPLIGTTSVCSTGTASGFICGINSSTYNSFALSGTFTYSLSASVTTPASNAQPNPANGYFLIGVATNTAAAGSYGNVIINGVAPLASTYATSSTSYGFNFNARNGNGFLGNKGYVVNRVVTLQGLE